MSRGVLVVAMVSVISAAVRICEAGMLGMLVEIAVGLAGLRKDFSSAASYSRNSLLML